MAGSQVKESESKFGISFFTYIVPGQIPVNKNLLPTLLSFAGIGHKGFSGLADFILVPRSKFFKIALGTRLDCFSWYHTYIFETNDSEILIKNLMLNQLAPISNPKMKSQKARVPFLISFFILRLI